ncbi:PTS fructose transporter subunit IIABC [Aneurinibacillus sp. REN35]|uniref:PTS fructose transporter subunit IIABC n=1 Tax=Aneurinibacillus sp. REN35 TaxID=3237286 RepID=UPI0035286B91
MRITELLEADTIVLDLSATTKQGVIDELSQKLERAGKLYDLERFRKAIFAREAQSTTGIGKGVAFPHAKTDAVKTPAIAFGRSSKGVAYDALDGKPSHLFFMIAVTQGADTVHLETLSRLSSLVRDEALRHRLLTASTQEEVLHAISDKENERDKQTADAATDPLSADAPAAQVLAVTACPTGIAHTYMAADALKAKAQELGIPLKVETSGAGGIKNELSKEEIDQAIAVIIAADKQVDLSRFAGKCVIQVPVTMGIHKPQELLERAVKQDGPICCGGEQGSREKAGGLMHGLYRHLMNGISHTLPFMIGGGILVALAHAFGFEGANPNTIAQHPVAAALQMIGSEYVLTLTIPVLAAFIAMSIADRSGFAPGMVGGLMAAVGEAGFLGGLLAGFAAGYISRGVKKVCAGLPSVLDDVKPVLIYPLLGILCTGLLMMYVVIIPAQAVNEGVKAWLSYMGTSNLIVFGLVLGSMMAVDMGGPMNKIAYTFGLAMIDAGQYAPFAAIMAGGMVPPLGLALATTFFANRFTHKERETGKVAYIQGFSFITEGAIPFVAADPVRVLPAAMAGSALAGALAMAFGIKLRVPHGGIFVIPIVQGSILLYMLAIVAGACVTALLVGLLKKPIQPPTEEADRKT